MVLLKKIVIAMMLTLLSFALFSSPSFADQKWDAFVAKMEQRAKIKEVGLPIIEALRQSAQGSEEELWLMTKRGETKSPRSCGCCLGRQDVSRRRSFKVGRSKWFYSKEKCAAASVAGCRRSVLRSGFYARAARWGVGICLSA